jgi:DNA-directed RNA polymerase specialized sigma24 family protein
MKDQDDFNALLAWLDADREEAGKKYENIRLRLVKFFACRGRHDAEELADETIKRVTLKAPALAQEYVGDPALYFYGVARMLVLEVFRKPPPAVPPTPLPEPDEKEKEDRCLEGCMAQLPQANRDLALEYYNYKKGQKVEHRRRLAERLGIGQNALRIRVHRIRAALLPCVSACLEHGPAA